MQSQHDLERVKDGFSVEAFMAARSRARECLHRIAERIVPGMCEPDAQAVLNDVLQAEGAAKPWHRPVIRLGADTTKAFQERSDPALALDADDMYFIDMAPVWDGYEADVGDAFVVGSNGDHRRCADDARAIFASAAEAWRGRALTGKALYAFAADEARSRGWLLNLDLDGHRLGDFPHHAYYRGGMSALDFHPSSGLWILEVQIRHPSEPYGAFYEDLLIA